MWQMTSYEDGRMHLLHAILLNKEARLSIGFFGLLPSPIL